MEISKIAKLVFDFIKKSKNTDASPGISYIVNKMLSLPALNMLLASNYTPKEILQIGYMVFFIFEGDDYVSAEWKSKNDLYFLQVKEVGDLEKKEIPCEDCDSSGYVTCSECDGERELSCEYCDGTGKIYDDGSECPYCDGAGYIGCETCDTDGETYCETCDGNQEVESDEDYVFFNEEKWVIGNPDTASQLERMRNSGELTDEIYDILDNDKGSVFLLSTAGDVQDMEFNDFEYEYGDYYDLKGHYIIESVKNLNDSKHNFYIDDRLPNNMTIK